MLTGLFYADYRGTLADGSQFDASYDRGKPLDFTLGAGQVIKGWDQGLLDMAIGEKRKLTIPPEMGYGARGFPPVIPANAELSMFWMQNDEHRMLLKHTSL